jgi:hypothetical protein
MSAVKRRLFNVLAAVSLVLCVSAVALWAISYWCAWSFGYYARPANGSYRDYYL